jgi:hypothetical protein
MVPLGSTEPSRIVHGVRTFSLPSTYRKPRGAPIPLMVRSVAAANSANRPFEMDDFITKALAERRSLEEALADLRARYQRRPRPDLAKMIRQFEAEISYRKLTSRNSKHALVDKPRALHAIGGRKEFMTHQRVTRSTILPLADDTSVKDIFADLCAGLNVLNGNVHFTFAAVVADHSEEPAPSRRVVSTRVVMPIAGAVELRDLLTRLTDALAAQGADASQLSAATTVTPLRKPR